MGDGDRTQIAIVGAGPAGLMLGRMLSRRGVETVVLESRSREYVESRVRAGVLEQGTVELLVAEGVGERLEREGNVHHGIELRFGGVGHRIAFDELAQGRGITIYGQQEVVKDLVAARVDGGLPLRFEAEVTASAELDSTSPVRPLSRRRGWSTSCGATSSPAATGSTASAARRSPAGALTVRERIYPFGWLGILAEVPPSSAELVYAYSERGFACTARARPSSAASTCNATRATSSTSGPTSGSGMSSTAGSPATTAGARPRPIVERGIAPMRSFVAEPMQHGRLFLAGDAVHIVPATGAKGLNLAIADVSVLAEALVSFYAPAGPQRSPPRRRPMTPARPPRRRARRSRAGRGRPRASDARCSTGPRTCSPSAASASRRRRPRRRVRPSAGGCSTSSSPPGCCARRRRSATR